MQQEKSILYLNLNEGYSSGSKTETFVGLIPHYDQNIDQYGIELSDEEETEDKLAADNDHRILMKMFFS